MMTIYATRSEQDFIRNLSEALGCAWNSLARKSKLPESPVTPRLLDELLVAARSSRNQATQPQLPPSAPPPQTDVEPSANLVEPPKNPSGKKKHDKWADQLALPL